MAIRLGAVVLEAREPRPLAEFYAALLEVPIARADGDWVELAPTGGAQICFQLAPEHQPPRWPDPSSSMQYHLDFVVEEIEQAEARALSLGATRQPGGSAAEVAAGERPPGDDGFRVYTDPAGHVFCLCWGG